MKKHRQSLAFTQRLTLIYAAGIVGIGALIYGASAAQANDISSQFPDLGPGSGRNFQGGGGNGGFSSDTQYSSGGGGRRGRRNFTHQPMQITEYHYPDSKGGSGSDNYSNPNYGNNSPSQAAPTYRGNAQYQASNYSPAPAAQPLSQMSGMPLSGPFSGVPAAARRPDKFADNPDVDTDGVRHFANGRHYDLKNTSIEQALASSATSDDQIKIADNAERQQKRMMQRQRRMQNMQANQFGF